VTNVTISRCCLCDRGYGNAMNGLRLFHSSQFKAQESLS